MQKYVIIGKILAVFIHENVNLHSGVRCVFTTRFPSSNTVTSGPAKTVQPPGKTFYKPKLILLGRILPIAALNHLPEPFEI